MKYEKKLNERFLYLEVRLLYVWGTAFRPFHDIILKPSLHRVCVSHVKNSINTSAKMDVHTVYLALVAPDITGLVRFTSQPM